MRIATWNVNGIRAREAQVVAWIAAERPDVICLQELKANPAQIPASLAELSTYHAYWHGEKAYSGVGLLLLKERFPEPPRFVHPDFDNETRIVTADLGPLTVASIYVPNGGKDYQAKLAFLTAMERFTADAQARGIRLVLCGDMNVTRTDQDVHPKERKPDAIGQRPDERALFEKVLSHGLVDVSRALDPSNDALFTWWAPWRKLRERNIGWRIDYILASRPVFESARESAVQASVGTSDHAPVAASFEI